MCGKMWTLKPPFPALQDELNEIERLKRIIEEGLRPDIDALEDIPEALKELCKRCWQHDSSRRPTSFAEIIAVLRGLLCVTSFVG